MRAFALLLGALIACMPLTASARRVAKPPPAVYSIATKTSRWLIRSDGTTGGVEDVRSGARWAKPGVLALLTTRDGKRYPSRRVRRRGSRFVVGFGRARVDVTLRVRPRRDYFEVTLASVRGRGRRAVRSLQLVRLHVAALRRAGRLINARWNDKVLVSLMALDSRGYGQHGGSIITAVVDARLGLRGRRFALIVVPPTRFIALADRLARRYRLPATRIGKTLFKRSRDNKTSYLFTQVSEANADEVIRVAKRGGFRYILISLGWARSRGSYVINKRAFPHGEAGLKAVARKAHAAGLKIGLHVMSGVVAKNDPLVTPVPDRRLLYDGITKLTATLARGASTLSLATTKRPFVIPAVGACVSGRGLELLVNSEIVACRQQLAPMRLAQCRRGLYGTRARTHRAGTVVKHLHSVFGMYTSDLSTSLTKRIARRVAGLLNRGRFDMVYFDGGGGFVSRKGPSWYYFNHVQTETVRRLRRPTLVQGSSVNHWSWHALSRIASGDYVNVARKLYLDHHRKRMIRFYKNNFLPIELGWWTIHAAAPGRRATRLDEVEHYAVRMVAHDIPGSLQAAIPLLKRNGRWGEMLDLLRRYERLRLRGVPANVRARLAHGEWHLRGRQLQRVRYQEHHAAMPGALHVKNAFGKQRLSFRIEAAPRIEPVGSKRNVVLYRSSAGVDLGKARGRGALAARVEFPSVPGRAVVIGAGKGGIPCTKVALHRHRALAVTLDVRGAATKGKPAVLNVQLATRSRTYRDYYIDLAFTGRCTVIVPAPRMQRLLREFTDAHGSYPTKSALRHFNYRAIVAVNLRWMRPDAARATRVRVFGVEALRETPAVLKNPRLCLGKACATIPAAIPAGGYAELIDGSAVRVFDLRGMLKATVRPKGTVPTLAKGANGIKVSADSGGSAIVTLVTFGESLALPATKVQK